MRAVPWVVDDGGAGAEVDAVEGSAAGIEVGWGEGEEARDGGGIQRSPVGCGVESDGERGEHAGALAEGERIESAEGCSEVGASALGDLPQCGFVVGVERDGE